jgi:hypothetical protein
MGVEMPLYIGMQGIKQTIRPYTASLSYVTCSTGAASQGILSDNPHG